MPMLSDIQIARQNTLEPITAIAGKIGIRSDGLELYGRHKAKLSLPQLGALLEKADDRALRGKLVLVTAITPTSAGEGKSTVSIGLGDGLSRLGKRTVIALREPSLGPCFGIKGGACGGGYAQIVPMEDINLHFTGDIHAISAANNLIAALVDNHIQQGNELGIDPHTITWRRCVDLNDRSLRNIVIGLGRRTDGVTREDHFSISVASEIMAIVCLSRTIGELKEKIGGIIVGQDYRRSYVRFGQLGYNGAVAALLRDAIKPNLVQTLEGTPVFVHGGPFANIAHGCNSINATLCALASGDYVVTEAGFAADLGAEKFFDIKCRKAGLEPSAVVLVATVRALKMHGGVRKADLAEPDVRAVRKGLENLAVHIENIMRFGVPLVVAVNAFSGDTGDETEAIQEFCARRGVRAVVSHGWAEGGAGTQDLARAVIELCGNARPEFRLLYPDGMSLREKIETIARELYRAGTVEFEPSALRKLQRFSDEGYGSLPVCIAKTQNSISHNPKLLGAPCNYAFPVRDAQLYAGAGFVVALAGDITTMPGLPKVPAAADIDIDDDGVISGLF